MTRANSGTETRRKPTQAQLGRYHIILHALEGKLQSGVRDINQVSAWTQRASDGQFELPAPMPENWYRVSDLLASLATIPWLQNKEAKPQWHLYDERCEADYGVNSGATRWSEDDPLLTSLEARCQGMGLDLLYHQAKDVAWKLLRNILTMKFCGLSSTVFGYEIPDTMYQTFHRAVDIADIDAGKDLNLQIVRRLVGDKNLAAEELALCDARWNVWRSGFGLFGERNGELYVYRRFTE